MADKKGDFTLDKPMPSNIEAERLILGVILLDNTTLNQAAERLKPDDFFLPSHRRIYEKMLYLYEQGRGIDPLTLQEELRRAGELEQVGGAAYVASLFDGVPRFSNIENYTRITKGKSIMRRLIHAASQVMTLAYDEEDEPEEVLDQAERLILSIAEDRIKQGFTPLAEVAEQQLKHIEEIAGREQLITGIATGFNDLDYMTSGLQRGDLIIVAARPSMGKCLTADAEILLADGSVATIAELYRRRRAELLTLGEDFKFKRTQPSAFVDDGIKPVYRVTTRLGRFVDSTLAHPYLTINGWRKLAELKVGERIAVPRRLAVFGNERLPEEEIERLADLLSGRSCTVDCPVCGRFGLVPFGSGGFQLEASADWTVYGTSLWLVEWRCDSHAKFIPPPIFRLPKEQLALFLNRLFATDGWVTLTAGQAPQLGYATVSEKLARQVQHLLLRFSVNAKLRKRAVKYAGGARSVWQLDITHGEAMRAFAAEIGIRGKDEQLAQVVAALSTERDLISVVLAQSEIYWDEIVSIEYLGERQVYDLTIPDTHNFVANDICVHNTAFCLNIAQNAALRTQHHGERAVVGVFSLEMSKEQLVNRMLCSQARIDAHRLRSGMLNKEDWRKLALAVGELSEARIFLDDTPGMGVLEMRAKARRLKNEQKALDLIVIDYMQLMSGRGRIESRQQEVSQISRELKMLAKELNVPLVALSQLSRAPEARTGSRPQLSDLRESGCLTGDSLVTIADSGARVPIRELVGRSGFDVWALNETTMQLERANVSRAFVTGVKPVLRLTTKLGRTIRATANHKFRAFAGWKRLDELRVGERLALPRAVAAGDFQTLSEAELALLGHLIGDGCTLPRHAIQYTTREQDLAETVAALAREVFGDEVAPRVKQERTWYQVYLSSTRHHTHNTRSAVTEWLMELGVWGLRSHEKRVPEKVFQQPAAAIALFLRHLWATDGCIRLKPGFYAPAVYYASSSERLARDVQDLLLRLGINAWLRCRSQRGKGRDQFHVCVTGKHDLDKFASLIGAAGAYKRAGLQAVSEYLQGRSASTKRDIIPHAVWREVVVPALQEAGLTTREMFAGIETHYSGTSIYQQNISRERAARVAQVIGSEQLTRLAQSDVYWDEIVALEPAGEEEVYDLTVDKHHNFVVNNLTAHNSIEQDADVVMFIYREEYYKPETEKQNIAEIIVGKQRNGPTGSVELVFLKQLTRFEDKYREA